MDKVTLTFHSVNLIRSSLGSSHRYVMQLHITNIQTLIIWTLLNFILSLVLTFSEGFPTFKQIKPHYTLKRCHSLYTIRELCWLTRWGSSTTVTYSTMFPPPSDTTTEVITHSYRNKSEKFTMEENKHDGPEGVFPFMFGLCLCASADGAHSPHDFIPAMLCSLLRGNYTTLQSV